jgi:anti-sigma factor RsiW
MRDETWQVKYLLGHLTEEEQAEVEDRAFADEGYRSALEGTEADLIDAYVRGELSPSDRRSFERRFLPVPERRRKVEFARALATIASDSKTPELPAAERRSVLRAFREWSPAFQFAAGLAALIVVAAGAWLVSENAASRSRVASLEVERRGFEAREQSLRQQLSEEQTRSAALAAQKPSPSEADRAPLIASLVLLPGLSRSQARVEQLVLSPGAQIARIEIQIEPRDDFPRFRAELRTKSGDEVLSQGNLAKRKSGSGFAVSIDVPASVLVVGEYEMALKGIAADRTTQDVGFYYFAVQRP